MPLIRRLIFSALSLLLVTGPATADDLEDAIMRALLKEVTASRSDSVDRTGDVDNAEDARAALDIRRVLKVRKVTVNFDGTPLEDALAFIQDVTTLNIVISKSARQLVNDGGHTVKLKLRDVKLKSVMALMLKGIDKELCYGVKFGVLLIGTKDEFNKKLRLEFYDISDITRPRPDFPAPPLGLKDPFNKK